MTNVNEVREICLTHSKPNFREKLEQMDNSLPGQLLRVAKFNQKIGLSTIVYTYYGFKRYQTDVSDPPENLID